MPLFAFLLLQIVFSSWQLIYSEFYQQSVSGQDWEQKVACSDNQIASLSARSCNNNPLDFMRLSDQKARLERNFYYPHHQVRLISDIFFFRAKPGTNSNAYIKLIDSSTSTTLYTRPYAAATLQQYDKVCQYSCGGGCSLDDTKVEYKTVIIDATNHQLTSFNISYCFNYQDQDQRLGIRNVLIYVNTCDFTCLSCSSTICLTCYQGSPIGGVCSCKEPDSFIQILTGCVEECNRDYYLADTQKHCQFDATIQSEISYFTGNTISNSNLLPYEPWVYIEDPFYYSNTYLKETCGSTDVIGFFYYNQGIKLNLQQNNALKYLRIRITFYLFGFESGSTIMIRVDNYSFGEIIKGATNYTYPGATLIKYDNTGSCGGNSYDRLRIETLLKIYSTTPSIAIQGLLSKSTEKWAFRNVTIDYKLCQNNCTTCATFITCSVCDTGFVLYRGTCVSTCPSYTQVLSDGSCQDFEDIIKSNYQINEDSRYLIKEFYDMNTTFERASVFDSYTTLGGVAQTSFTGSLYSFVPEKAVLGGVLVWQAGKFTKTFTSLLAHYQISYRLNFTYGDENNGWFKYNFGGQISSQINNPNTNTNNIAGDSKKETTLHVELIGQSHSLPSLLIELSADTNAGNLDDAFMYISEYFIVVHYCAPFCSACNGPLITDCNAGSYTGYNSTNYCQSNEFLYYDSTLNTYSCITCSLNGCLECASANECTRCAYSSSNYYLLVNGNCQCYPSYYQSVTNCLQCSRYCETCFGSTKNECLTCVSDFHRSIYQFSCNCIPGYYDDGSSLICQPICGDMIVVDGEDCDDGNSNPFDRCDLCQYACQDSCLDCQEGLCYECDEGYDLNVIIHYCFPLCGDLKIEENEECDNVYGGCNNCQFQCYDHCTDCQFGVCYQCDETNGYYLTGSACEPICGDGIIAEYEDCDDGNYNPFDFCDLCVDSCSQYCDQCANGHCIACQTGFQYISTTKQCISICGDLQVVGQEQCDDNNSILYDGCYQCQFKCQDSCTNCFYGKCLECNTSGWEIDKISYSCIVIVNDGIIVSDYEQCDDGNIVAMDGCWDAVYDCQDSCISCYKGYCLNCLTNWQLDSLCYPICGDGITVGTEVCDDNNTQVYDGCYLCQSKCDQNCIICQYGMCNSCQYGYYLQNNLCISNCGDQILVGNEQCDNLDDCFQCQYNCNNCDICVQRYCLVCSYGYQLQEFECYSLCGDGIISGLEQCDDENGIPFDGCYECQYQCQDECLNCQYGKCLICADGYNVQNNKCVEQCGDSIVTANEQCDDSNLIAQDGCFECQYSCPEECSICQSGYCLACSKLGWYVQQPDFTCQTICGDSIIAGVEQCDDGNNITHDGCNECYFECQIECTNCIKNQCYECNTVGWTVDINTFTCIPVCGDSLILGSEQCDDGNDISYDGCYNCQFECQQECTNCNNGQCLECNTLGWKLSNSTCINNCGDGILITPYEQCDDGNDILYDGCDTNCQYQCQLVCSSCIDGQCYECGELGWIVKGSLCVPYCGDGLIVGNEQCDVGTDILDTCVNCQFACDSHCSDCNNGICYACDTGRYLDTYNRCLSLCGDGILVDEECDDGNLDDGDGCSSTCQIENDWVCLNTQLSVSSCFFSISPSFQLTLLTQNPDETELVQLSFNQLMQLSYNETISPDIYFNATIINLLQTQYTITFNFTVPPTFQTPSDVQATLTIQFFENVEQPTLVVVMNDTAIVSEYNTQVLENQQTLKLKTPTVISAGQVLAAQGASSFTNVVIYTMVTLSGLCLLTGSFEMFWNLMDLLQYLSYIKYINIQFPTNLNIYFAVFNLISLQPLLDLLGVTSIIDSFSGGEGYFIPTSDKFAQDNLNAYFLSNFQSTLFCLFGLYAGYYISKLLTGLLYKIGPYHVSKIGYYPGKVVFLVRNILKISMKEFHYNGILRLIMSNYYDMSFSVFIQLINFSTVDKISTFNSYWALLTLAFQIFYFIYQFTKTIAFSKHATTKEKNKYQALFEGVSQSQDVWVKQYNCVLLIKKQFFIFLIVYMESNGTLQTMAVALNETLFLLFIIFMKPLENIHEYYKTLITEALLTFNTLLFLAYAYKLQLELTVSQYIMIGWIHITTFSLILIYSLLSDLKQQMVKLYRKIAKILSGNKHIEVNNQVILFY